MEEYYDERADYDLSSEASEEEEALPWISWFCSLSGHEFFCQVDEEFIDDEFNLTGLAQQVNYYSEALDIILDIDNEDSLDERLEGSEIAMVEMSAEILYGLIHSRYILTRAGLEQMAQKYQNAEFGYCPRYLCSQTKVLPCGLTDLLEQETVRLYCPSCHDVYTCSGSRFQTVDGKTRPIFFPLYFSCAYFGTTFPHLFFDTFPQLAPKNALSTRNQPPAIYTPKIFGFGVSKLSRISSLMKWLRMKPSDESAIEEYKSTKFLPSSNSNIGSNNDISIDESA
ncbi:hypothetical protein BB560_002405 [Smittium megazygosporum]|uniref:Casein kinase II subunit beta n=1 Tax=Smittium megazygosporum TaxID=133381 RepID=A0A2T9ZEX1_9FUNG|nr:hypothetical protein BB560_002405 [Smittium megazygosporum]